MLFTYPPNQQVLEVNGELGKEFESVKGMQTKIFLLKGYLHEKEIGQFNLRYEIDEDSKNSIGYGFIVDIWNNNDESVTRADCFDMLTELTDIIKTKYSKLIELLGATSS